MDLTDPSTATLTIAKALEVAGIRAAVYGGLALAAYGEARETKDAHFAVAGISAASSVAALTANLEAAALAREIADHDVTGRMAMILDRAAKAENVAG